MIDTIMQFGTEIVFVRVSGNSISFSTSSQREVMSTIEGMKLDYNGTIKEFPDLKDNDNWRTEAIKRFKVKIKNMKSEDEVNEYIINDLRKFGYAPIKTMKFGSRWRNIKNG